jgi:putative transcriptional regulator
MDHEMKAGDNLTGSLLVAHPDLHDPNFRRTIVFLSEHSPEEGATGFVLNRPIEFTAERGPKAPAFFGGPVEAGKMLLASLQWRDNPSMVAYRIFNGGEDEESRRGCEDGLRVFAGCSGWSAGQLEQELQQNAWLVVPPTRELIEMKSPTTAWKKIMRSSGPFFHLLSEAPDDPRRN